MLIPVLTRYPLREVLFLVVCGTIASGDDYDDILSAGIEVHSGQVVFPQASAAERSRIHGHG
jgi:hypothetical protein